MIAFLGNLLNGLQLYNYVLGGGNWIAIILVSVIVLIISRNNGKIPAWFADRFKDKTWGRWLNNPFLSSIAVGFVVAFFLFSLVLGAAGNVLQPQVFAGWVSDGQLAFGRHVGTITIESENGQQYCGHAFIIGDIKNVSSQPLTVASYNQQKIWSSNPSVDFDQNVSLTGLSGNGAYLVPGQSVSITVDALEDPSECQSTTADDIRRLRSGRLNTTGGIQVTQGTQITGSQFNFEDLPVFPGD